VYDDQNDQHPRGLRILVVDDNHDVTCGMSMLLELEGYQTGAVQNGLEAAREAIRVRKPVCLEVLEAALREFPPVTSVHGGA
jgi:CheY-like chemotaxis protein